MIRDIITDKPRGYAFIEFKHEEDMKIAFKDADGMKIDGRRIVVDCERGRTVKGWKPRRLGGGLGGTRIGGRDVNQRFSGRARPVVDGRGGHRDDSRGYASSGVRGRSRSPPRR
jgi:U1 small nuclear ribonucleoprotein